MNESHASATDESGAGRYEFRIKGHLDDRWGDWLEGLTLTRECNGLTMLVGALADQAALHGVLNRIRDLALPIISVQRVGPIEESGKEETS